MRIITVLIPLAEVSGYTTILRSLTQGRANPYMEFSHYQEAPANITEKIVSAKTGNASEKEK
jgi:elongation factor G